MSNFKEIVVNTKERNPLVVSELVKSALTDASVRKVQEMRDSVAKTLFVKEEVIEEEVEELDEATRTAGYVGTARTGDDDPVWRHSRDVVHSYNKANKTNFRVSREGRMGKDNPAAAGYKANPSSNRYQNIKKADAKSFDVYVHPRDRWQNNPTGHVDRNAEHKHLDAIKSQVADRLDQRKKDDDYQKKDLSKHRFVKEEVIEEDFKKKLKDSDKFKEVAKDKKEYVGNPAAEGAAAAKRDDEERDAMGNNKKKWAKWFKDAKNR